MKKEKEKRRDDISMKGIKNYFKPDSEIVAKETKVENNTIAKETRNKPNARLLKECHWWLKNHASQAALSLFRKQLLASKTVLANLDGLPNSTGWITMK